VEAILRQFSEQGQSIWLDYIRRAYIREGGLARATNQGVRGVTSNPAIFEKAIAGSDDYDAQLWETCGLGVSPVEVYEALALEDIRMAADTLRAIYEATDGADGFVSLEVSPDLAHDTDGTIAEALRLWTFIDRPNVLIKVPATDAGIPAIEVLTGEGINVNVTLIFSQEQYEAVAEAYISGLERRAAADEELCRVSSVASFFVSRVDTNVDGLLDELDTPAAGSLRGKIGIANAKLAYQRFKELFSGERWERLADRGARVQRPLWASTSTKDPAYPDTLYADALIGPDTVNTLPPETLDAVLDHGRVANTLEADVDQAQAHVEGLEALGIDLHEVTAHLLEEGIAKFASPFGALLESISDKCRSLGLPRFRADLGDARAAVDEALGALLQDEIVERIWELDYHVWRPNPAEISNRLGWLTSPAVMRRHLAPIITFADEVRAAGYTDVLLLGMGGSSLGPDVFSAVFGTTGTSLRVHVLDSTEPGAVVAYATTLEPETTLYIASSKSGTTAETLSFLTYFYTEVSQRLGSEHAGAHFAVITDPGTSLATLARSLGFRAVFENIPTIGGRYSVLSNFGLVPAALLGMDVALLLDRALGVASPADQERSESQTVDDAVAAELGVIMATLAQAGRDKLTLVTSPALANFGDWVEQLVAESSGKEGTGILPIVNEVLGPPDVYGDDRLFVHLCLEGDASHGDALAALAEAGHPVITMQLRDRYDIGEQIFVWEMATAIASHRLGVQPFDQPNVEAAKVQARKMVAAYREEGRLPEGQPMVPSGAALRDFLSQAAAGDYVALQAYIRPTEATTEALQALRHWIRDHGGVATTLGYGPRYLHSTGQLHKGDGGHGLFVQFTADAAQDVAIPDGAGSLTSSLTFGVLVRAQALGDYQALIDAGRRVLHIHLGEDVVGELRRLLAEVGA